MRGCIPPVPNTSSWRGAELSTGQIYFYLSTSIWESHIIMVCSAVETLSMLYTRAWNRWTFLNSAENLLIQEYSVYSLSSHWNWSGSICTQNVLQKKGGNIKHCAVEFIFMLLSLTYIHTYIHNTSMLPSSPNLIFNSWKHSSLVFFISDSFREEPRSVQHHWKQNWEVSNSFLPCQLIR